MQNEQPLREAPDAHKQDAAPVPELDALVAKQEERLARLYELRDVLSSDQRHDDSERDIADGTRAGPGRPRR